MLKLADIKNRKLRERIQKQIEQEDALRGNPAPARVRTEKPERDQRGQSQDRGVATPAECVHYCITFIVRRPRLLDHGDNDRNAIKPGRDLIAEWLGFRNDDDPRLEWRYEQIKAPAKSTTVIIETFQAPL